MDGGWFYGRGIRSEPPGVVSSHHFSKGHSALWVPEQMRFSPSPLHSETAVNQKLDRVVILLETQRKEIEYIRADTALLKAEVEQLK